MLFRKINGELIEINRYDFKTDKLYYEKILELKMQFSKLKKTFQYKNN